MVLLCVFFVRSAVPLARGRGESHDGQHGLAIAAASRSCLSDRSPQTSLHQIKRQLPE